jgi:D-alanyl-D-alanine carboxypeptidase
MRTSLPLDFDSALARRALSALFVSTLMVGGASASPARAAPSTFDRNAVIAAVPSVVAAGAPSFIWHAVDESGEWSAAAGVSDIKKGTPANPESAFRIGSISKMFVAVAILQLVAEGRIGLDTPVSNYLPGLLTAGNVITIRELLQHRSGLGATEFGNGRGNTWFPALNASCRDDFDPIAVIKAADIQLFAPGSDFNYANAGYTTLGLVIQKVTGESYEQVLYDRIVVPLGLTHTSFQEGAPQWPTPYVDGYGNFLPGAVWHKNYTDETDCKMSIFGAAGSGISTGRDLTTFLRALTGGLLLPDYLYQQMIDVQPTDLGPGVGYGLGIIALKACGVSLLGHGGGVWGYETDLWTTTDGTRTSLGATQLYPGTDAIWSATSTVNRAEYCSAD